MLQRAAFIGLCKYVLRAFLNARNRTDRGEKTAIKKASDHSDLDIFVTALQSALQS